MPVAWGCLVGARVRVELAVGFRPLPSAARNGYTLAGTRSLSIILPVKRHSPVPHSAHKTGERTYTCRRSLFAGSVFEPPA
jgi:hypothetical protein